MTPPYPQDVPQTRTSSTDVAWTATDLAGDVHGRADKAARVRRMFAAIAHRYDLNNRLHSFGRDQAWRRRAVALAATTPADEVLDVACGTGDLAEAFADAGVASVTGLDYTGPMLALAAGKAARRRVVPRPRYVLGDAQALPFPGARFDVVSIAFGIRNVADPDGALREFHRVLRPGGRVVVLEFGRPRNRALRRLNDLYAKRVMPVTAGWLAGDRSGAYRYLPRSIDAFLGPTALAGAVAAAGFEMRDQVALTFGVAVVTVGVKPPVKPPAR